ncbi:MAG: ABC transporter permease, partial [Planctomycetota bacterium]
MNAFRMAERNLRQRPLSSALTAISIALGVALVIVVSLLERETRNAFRRTAVGVEILVAGNKGSRIDALLSALYHVGRAPGRASWEYYEELKADSRVEHAIPLAVGDNYRGIPVVGTDAALFTDFQLRPGRPLDCDGEVFSPGGGGMAVAASRSGLKIGDRFVASHGAGGGYEHDDFEFRVTGVVRPTGTAHDRVIWIDIRDF